MKLFFDDVSFDGQLQRSIGKADSGMANVGECLAIAQQITPGDRDSWYEAWSTFAGQLVKQGKKASAAGHKVSARNAFFALRSISGKREYKEITSRDTSLRIRTFHGRRCFYIGGYDGTAEELYASVSEVLSRGYAFAALDGPGEGAVLYDEQIPMSPDWENVVPGMVTNSPGIHQSSLKKSFLQPAHSET